MTTQTDEALRVRNYLQSQGERYTFTELWLRFVKARITLIDSVADVSQEQADFRPDEDEWSISEVLHHITTSSGRGAEVVESLTRGEIPTPDRIDPPRETSTATIEELRNNLTDDSIAWSAMIGRLPPAPSTEPTMPHTFFGELHARAWFLFQRVHDLDHAGQVGVNKASPGYPA